MRPQSSLINPRRLLETDGDLFLRGVKRPMSVSRKSLLSTDWRPIANAFAQTRRFHPGLAEVFNLLVRYSPSSR